MECDHCWFFTADAQNVFLSLETYEVQEVATALKRLFRTMEVPLLTAALYPKWISTSGGLYLTLY